MKENKNVDEKIRTILVHSDVSRYINAGRQDDDAMNILCRMRHYRKERKAIIRNQREDGYTTAIPAKMIQSMYYVYKLRMIDLSNFSSDLKVKICNFINLYSNYSNITTA